MDIHTSTFSDDNGQNNEWIRTENHTLDYGQQNQDQGSEPLEQGRHVPYYMNLTLRPNHDSSIPNSKRVLRIFAALTGATMINLATFFLMSLILFEPTENSTFIIIYNIAWVILFVGLALSWCVIGTLLLDIWRSKPLQRFSFLLTLVLLLSIPLFLLYGLNGHWFSTFLNPLGFKYAFLLIVSLVLLQPDILPLYTAAFLLYMSCEVCKLRQEAPAYTRLSFVLVSGMVLMVLSGLILSISSCLNDSLVTFLFYLPFTSASVIVTICSFFMLRKRTKTYPKDASPFEMNSSHQ